MARRSDAKQATETLAEIESVFDRAANWVGDNPNTVLGVLGGILLVAAVLGVGEYLQRQGRDEAAAAVAEVQTNYLREMGAAPGSFVVTEPANPETAREVRQEYVAQFLTVAEEHSGTAAAVSALLEAATLQEEAGDPEAALTTFERARDEAASGTELRGLALSRLARAYESADRLADAGEAHAEAGRIASLPTRRLALADAARCFAQSGDTERALALWSEAQELDQPEIPQHVRARLAELEAASGS